MTRAASRFSRRNEGRKTGSRQLSLLPPVTDTRLDERTKATGRAGIARARAALASHRPTDDIPTRRAS